MSDIKQADLEVSVYGSPLKGEETDLEKTKLARKWYLKTKIRRWLAWQSGDTQDILADLTKVLVLGQAVSLGIVTDKAVIDKYKAWVQALLDGYTIVGIQDSMQNMLDGLDTLVFKKYNVAKELIDRATTEKAIRDVDVEDRPVDSHEML